MNSEQAGIIEGNESLAMVQAKKSPKRSDRRSLRAGRAVVSWGPQTYGKPQIIASSLVEDIDDLVAVVLQAQAEIRAE